VLNVALVPNQNQQKVFASVGPLGTYLKRALGVTVNLTVPANYAAVVQGMASGHVDVAYFGGLTYEQAKKFVPCEPIVTAAHGGVTTYHSLIIVPANSPYHLITDLAGQKKITFAFGDPSSTSGHLYPLVGLNDAGINPDKDFAHVRFTGNHQAAALAVENGAAQAGAVEDDILTQLEKQGVVDATKIRVIWESASIPGYPWVAREALGATTIRRITTAFLSIHDAAVFKGFLGGTATAFVPARDQDYATVRAYATRTGLVGGQ
ncbi:MAG: phosphate/phosphite/phosphonate ABC transporter substrate-binding protein, partial [Chloroflexi bacterium]|nr:phosphate/phosphite/phosphonate ABC transporter substrate-binding protein [Chloroflexota bacterium]